MGKKIIACVVLVLFAVTPAWAGDKKDDGKDSGKGGRKVMHGVRDTGNKASTRVGDFLKPLVKPLDEKIKQQKK